MQKSGVSANIAEFEKVFEDLDVNVEGLSGALDSVTATTSADQLAIEDLLQQMQGEAGLNAQ